MSAERGLIAATRQLFNNAKIQLRDVQAVAADAKPEPGHVVGFVVDPGAFVMVRLDLDLRTSARPEVLSLASSGGRGRPQTRATKP